MPDVVTFANDNTVTYAYDAAGSKLSVAYQSGGTTTKKHAGNKVYKNGTLSMILTGEGYATHDGSVTRIATIDSGDTNAGGNRVQITSEGGEVSTYYMHLDAITEGLEVGTSIIEGTQIGTLGGSGDGKSTRYTPHLHYELNIDGQRVNPVVSTTRLIDPQTRLTPIRLPEVTVTGQAAAARLPQVNVPEPRIPDIRLPEQRR